MSLSEMEAQQQFTELATSLLVEGRAMPKPMARVFMSLCAWASESHSVIESVTRGPLQVLEDLGVDVVLPPPESSNEDPEPSAATPDVAPATPDAAPAPRRSSKVERQRAQQAEDDTQILAAIRRGVNTRAAIKAECELTAWRLEQGMRRLVNGGLVERRGPVNQRTYAAVRRQETVDEFLERGGVIQRKPSRSRTEPDTVPAFPGRG